MKKICIIVILELLVFIDVFYIFNMLAIKTRVNSLNAYSSAADKYARILQKDKKAAFRAKVNKYVAKVANDYGIDKNIVLAVIEVESHYNPNARGKYGEIGLMQIRLSTAKIFNPYMTEDVLANWKVNISIGTEYLAENVHRFGKHLGILAYNGGAGILKNRINEGYYLKVKKEMLNACD